MQPRINYTKSVIILLALICGFTTLSANAVIIRFGQSLEYGFFGELNTETAEMTRINTRGVDNHIKRTRYYVRMSGDQIQDHTREVALSELGTPEIDFPNPDPRPDDDTSLTYTHQNVNIKWTSSVDHGIIPQHGDSASIFQELWITNNTSAPINLSVFHVTDVDLAGRKVNHLSQIFTQTEPISSISALIQPGESPLRRAGVAAHDDQPILNAMRYQIGHKSEINSLFTDNQVATLNNEVTSTFDEDLAIAYQLDYTIPAFNPNLTIDDQTIRTAIMTLDVIYVIPEPSSLFMSILLAGLLLKRKIHAC